MEGYIESMLKRLGMEGCKLSRGQTPISSPIEDFRPITADERELFMTACGMLGWLAGTARQDVKYAHSRILQHMATPGRGALRAVTAQRAGGAPAASSGRSSPARGCPYAPATTSSQTPPARSPAAPAGPPRRRRAHASASKPVKVRVSGTKVKEVRVSGSKVKEVHRHESRTLGLGRRVRVPRALNTMNMCTV